MILRPISGITTSGPYPRPVDDDRVGDLTGRATPDPGAFPGAVAPDRARRVDAHGVAIAVHEWGSADAPPLFLLHGGFDFARTFSVFAPLLAAAGWRVVSWDHRGHGDSDHSALYSWEADVRDALAVIAAISETTTSRRSPIVGHSKGGGLSLQVANAFPARFSHVVTLDGMPSRQPMPDVSDRERQKMVGTEASEWLDYRRSTATRERKPGTLEQLAERRRRMNPRLPIEWLRYLVTVGARRDPDGWRWKLDPTLRFGGFGPWRPEWMLQYLTELVVPVLGVLVTEPEPMGWGTRPRDVEQYLPRGARLEVLPDTGHFLHIERPVEVAEMVLDFLR